MLGFQNIFENLTHKKNGGRRGNLEIGWVRKSSTFVSQPWHFVLMTVFVLFLLHSHTNNITNPNYGKRSHRNVSFRHF